MKIYSHHKLNGLPACKHLSAKKKQPNSYIKKERSVTVESFKHAEKHKNEMKLNTNRQILEEAEDILSSKV
jgi:hypothetical protein